MTTPFTCYICHERISPNSRTATFYTPSILTEPYAPPSPATSITSLLHATPHTVHLSCYQHLLGLTPNNKPRVFPKYKPE